MKMRGGYLRLKTYRTLLLSFVVTLAVSLAVISTIVYTLYSQNGTQDLVEISRTLVTQVNQNCERLHREVSAVSAQLLSNSDVLFCMNASNRNLLSEYHATLKMRDIQAVYEYVNYIGIHNQKTKTTLSRKWGYTADRDAEILELLSCEPRAYLKTLYRHILPDSAAISQRYIEAEETVYTFLFYPNYLKHSDHSGALSVNISQDELNRIALCNTPGNGILLLDESGLILAQDENLALSTQDVSALFSQTDALLSGFGSNQLKLANQDFLVLCQKNDLLGWYTFRLLPTRQLFNGLQTTRRMFFILSLTLLFTGTIVAITLLHRSYQPVGKAMSLIGHSETNHENEFDQIAGAFLRANQQSHSLQEVVAGTSALLRSALLQDLVHGRDLSPYASFPIYKDLAAHLDARKFRVLTANLDRNSDDYRLRQAQAALDDALSPFVERYSAVLSEQLVFLLCINDVLPPDAIKSACAAAIASLPEDFGFSLTIGVGIEVEDVESIPFSYNDACEMLSNQLCLGAGHIIDAYELHKRQIVEQPYPSALEKRLLDAVSNCQPEKADEALHAFLSDVSVCPYSNAVLHIAQLYLALTRLYPPCANSGNVGVAQSMSELLQTRSMDVIAQILKTNVHSTILDLTQRRTLGNHTLAVQIQTIIDHEYADDSLSLDSLAEKTSLSTGHLSRTYKTYYGRSIGNAIIEKRMSVAEQMLLHSTDSISIIAEKVGIPNSNYFATLFRKKFGMSPSRYRQEKA